MKIKKKFYNDINDVYINIQEESENENIGYLILDKNIEINRDSNYGLPIISHKLKKN